MNMEKGMNDVFKDWSKIISPELELKLAKAQISIMGDEIEKYKNNWKTILKENRDLRRKLLEKEKNAEEGTLTEKQGELIFEYMNWESFKWPECVNHLNDHDMITALNRMSQTKDWQRFVGYAMHIGIGQFSTSSELISWLMVPYRFFQLMGEWLELIANEADNTTHHHETGRDE